jgi:RNA polymerase sigma factor (sigma-70 family)
MLEALSHPEDFLLAQKCLEADPLAIRKFQETYRAPLLNYLTYSGATAEEAVILVDELLSDCLAERPPRQPRLATYSGNSPLQAWLKAVALNKLLQKKRADARTRTVIIENVPREAGSAMEDPVATAPSDEHESTETPLLEIMRESIEAAFRECDPEDFLLVQLAHTNGLRGRELARLFSCSESKISRSLETARSKIAEATMRHVKAHDKWLVLKWEDFVELCRVANPATFGVE